MSTFLQRFRSSSKAFTVIELLLVVGIITILTGVFLIQQRNFDSSTLLRSLTYRAALSIREAQTYGVSVRFAGTGASYQAASAYGVYVSAANPDTYILFADTLPAGAPNRAYDVGEEVDTFTLRNAFSIKNFSASTNSATTESTLNGGTLTSLTIMFVRPNTDACIRTSASSASQNPCGSTPNPAYTRAYIQLQSPSGATRGITIYNSGQISVGAPGS